MGLGGHNGGSRSGPSEKRGDRAGATAKAPTLSGAVEEVYRALALIRFEGAHFRTDVAARGL
jgi:phosphoribosylamine-glycine ligase